MGKSILAWSGDGAQSEFTFVYELSKITEGGKFINVSSAIVNNSEIPGLPQSDGQGLLLWGSGLYRRSNSYLAHIPLNEVEHRCKIHYFAGMTAGSRRPIWSKKESEALPLFEHPHIGELSVTWNQFLRVWIILYNADNPFGINFRTSEKPWGPWSPTSLLFEPRRDNGYCHFIHQSWDDGVCDTIYDGAPPQGVFDYGAQYGPYVISKYTKGDKCQSTIYFLMSTWNPYNVLLMRSTLVVGPDEPHSQLSGNPALIQRRYGTRNFEGI